MDVMDYVDIICVRIVDNFTDIFRKVNDYADAVSVYTLYSQLQYTDIMST